MGRVAWILFGALVAAGLAAVLSIGVFLLLLAAGLGTALVRREVRGSAYAPLGAGLAFLVFGLLALPWHACTGVSSVSVPPSPGHPSSSSCGGVHPAIWFAIALALAAVAAVNLRPRRPAA
jgi:hypothetical protein